MPILLPYTPAPGISFGISITGLDNGYDGFGKGGCCVVMASAVGFSSLDTKPAQPKEPKELNPETNPKPKTRPNPNTFWGGAGSELGPCRGRMAKG